MLDKTKVKVERKYGWPKYNAIRINAYDGRLFNPVMLGDMRVVAGLKYAELARKSGYEEGGLRANFNGDRPNISIFKVIDILQVMGFELVLRKAIKND